MTWLKNDSAGFTLIEILVALAISGIVLTGIFFVFETSNKSYILQEDIARMQQNVRTAKYFLEKDLRMTGYGVRGLAFNGAIIDPIRFVNNDFLADANIIDNTDTITLTYIKDDANSCGTGGTKSPCTDLRPLLLEEGMPVNSAEAKIQQDLNDPLYSMWYDGCSCGGTTYDYPGYGFQVIITSPDGSMSELVWLTQVQPGGGGTKSKIQNRKYNGQENKVFNSFPKGSTIKFFDSTSLKSIRYYIDTDYFLRREVGGTGNKIAENIEDMQFAFCGDFNGDGVVDTEAADDWFDEENLVAGEMTKQDKAKIRFVRVTILGRTQREHQGISSFRSGIEDHAASGQKDFYSRRLLSFTVKIRNLGLDD